MLSEKNMDSYKSEDTVFSFIWSYEKDEKEVGWYTFIAIYKSISTNIKQMWGTNN